MLNEKQKTLRGDWLRVNKNSIVHYSTDLLTFDPYYVWHSALSSFVRFFRYRLVGRESDRTSLRLSDSQFSQRRRLHIIYLRVYSVRGRFFLHVCITWEYIHLAHSTRPYLLSSGQNENFIFKECSIPPSVNPLKPHIMISIQLGRWMHIICISTYSCWACRCN